MFVFKKDVMKTMSKSPSRHLLMLQGKLEIIEVEKDCLHIHKFYYIFLYFNVLVISRFR